MDLRIQTALDNFQNAETVEKAEAAVEVLHPKERIAHFPLILPSSLKFLNPNRLIAYFRADNSRETTREDLKNLYRKCTAIMVAAKKQADEAHIPLRIFMGECHGDRTGLAIEVMLLLIARRMGITDFGVERPQQGFNIKNKFYNIDYMNGTEEICAEIAQNQGKILPEESDRSIAGTLIKDNNARKNDEFLLQAALTGEPKMTVHALDPEHEVAPNGDGSPEDLMLRRDRATAEIFGGFKEKSTITEHGASHLPSLLACSKDHGVKVLAFNTINTFPFALDEGEAVKMYGEFLANPKHILTAQSSLEAASSMGTSESSGDDIIHVLLPGKGFTTAKEAVEMAKSVHNELKHLVRQSPNAWSGRLSFPSAASNRR
jgi:hypothetical protein